MSNTPHDFLEDFPQLAEKVQALKASDAHFARLYDEYHDVNRAVHRAETRVDLMSEEEEEHLRKKRAALKDDVYRMVTK